MSCCGVACHSWPHWLQRTRLPDDPSAFAATRNFTPQFGQARSIRTLFAISRRIVPRFGIL
jgi:hypothetical protein